MIPEILQDCYGTAPMRAIFSDRNRLQRMLDVEAALARATAACGLIPREAADEISRKATVERMDLGRLKAETARTGNHVVMPLVSELERACADGYGEFVHWGATSQDIVDTALVLQLREAFELLFGDLLALQRALVALAERHLETPVAGRTHGQHAVPTTFGFKAAVWASETGRHVARMEQLKPRLLVGSLSGAVGTLAALGNQRKAVQEAMMRDLGLPVPVIAWHTSRDGVAELVAVLGLICATSAKICNEVINLSRPEIAEVEEPHLGGKLGSSTMPHKRNPAMCGNVVALEKLVRRQVGLAIEVMMHEHERDPGCWMAEWVCVPEACTLSAQALASTRFVIDNLTVFSDRMRRNIDTTRGLIFSEAVMMKLATKVGRQKAHEALHEACMRAVETGLDLEQALRQSPLARAHLSAEEVAAVFDLSSYVESARADGAAVIQRAKAAWAQQSAAT